MTRFTDTLAGHIFKPTIFFQRQSRLVHVFFSSITCIPIWYTFPPDFKTWENPWIVMNSPWTFCIKALKAVRRTDMDGQEISKLGQHNARRQHKIEEGKKDFDPSSITLVIWAARGRRKESRKGRGRNRNAWLPKGWAKRNMGSILLLAP